MKVLITDEMHPALVTDLQHLGWQVDYRPDINNEETLQIINQYEILIISTKTIVDKNFINQAIRLKIVARGGSGMENIDSDYAQQKGIICFNTPEGNCNAVAEHCIGLLLNLMNHISRSANEVMQGKWNRESNRGEELQGKTIGIIGFGHTGSTLARRLRGFDVEILYTDPYNNHTYDFAKKVDITTLQEKADIISFHVPLTEETFHILNADFIDNCTKNIYIINASRGKVMDTSSVLSILDSPKLLGLGLDVLENEKLSTYTVREKEQLNKLLQSPKVLITPHIAGWSHRSKRMIAEAIVKKLEIYTKGKNVI